MSHHDLLDVAESVLLAPLRDHPEEFNRFRDEVLYAPLEGSKKAKKRAQADALAQMGVDINAMQAGTGMGRKVRQAAKKAKKKDEEASDASRPVD